MGFHGYGIIEEGGRAGYTHVVKTSSGTNKSILLIRPILSTLYSFSIFSICAFLPRKMYKTKWCHSKLFQRWYSIPLGAYLCPTK
jgi:hypothetical protein